MCTGALFRLTRLSPRPAPLPVLAVGIPDRVGLFYKGSACKSSANLDDIAVSKTPVYLFCVFFLNS